MLEMEPLSVKVTLCAVSHSPIDELDKVKTIISLHCPPKLSLPYKLFMSSGIFTQNSPLYSKYILLQKHRFSECLIFFCCLHVFFFFDL